MSLYIDVDRVQNVLLADGWHNVKDNSFDLDAYEFQCEDVPLALGADRIPRIGATWIDYREDWEDTRIYCPLTAILAVRTKKK